MFCTCSDAVVWCHFRYSVCKDLNGVVGLSGTGWSKFVDKFFILMMRQPGTYTLTVTRHFEKLCVIDAGTPTIWSSVDKLNQMCMHVLFLHLFKHMLDFNLSHLFSLSVHIYDCFSLCLYVHVCMYVCVYVCVCVCMCAHACGCVCVCVRVC